MADRIFTTNDPQYSKRELNKIDWDKVAEGIPAVRTAQGEGSHMNCFGLVTGILGTGSSRQASSEVDGGLDTTDVDRLAEAVADNDNQEERSAGKAPWLDKYRFKSKGDKDKGDKEVDDKKDKEVDDKEDTKEDAKQEREASTGTIVFTDQSQISAAAIRTAEAAGDERLVKAILAAREESRERQMQKYASTVKDRTKREAQTRRAQYRQAIVESADDTKTASASVPEVDFKSPAEMDEMQKSVIAEKARAMGFDQEYVDRYIVAMCGTKEDSPYKDQLDRIASTAEPMVKKAEKVEAMLREAKLDEANKRRMYDYWTKELGYDKDWAAKLFLTNYED